MSLLGIHLTAGGATAVIVDPESGAVQSAVSAGDASDAAARAIDQASADAIVATGIAVDALESHDTETLAQRLGGRGPVQVVTASTACVTAETWVGAARGARNVVCLWIGDTVVGGIMIEGRPWAGAHGFAGSAGWFALNPVERQDYRKLGSLTAEVSGKGIAKRLAWRIQAGDESAVLNRAGSLEAITSQHVFDGARAADGVAVSVVRDVARYIAMAVSNLVTAVDPDIVVLTGSIASSGDLLGDAVRQEAARRLPPSMAQRFRFEVSSLGANSIAIGAARVAFLGLKA